VRQIMLCLRTKNGVRSAEEYEAAVHLAWDVLTAMFTDVLSPFYERVQEVVQLEGEAECAQAGVQFAVLLGLRGAKASLCQPKLRRLLKQAFPKEADMLSKQVVPQETDAMHLLLPAWHSA
jgi:hypothetical protein